MTIRPAAVLLILLTSSWTRAQTADPARFTVVPSGLTVTQAVKQAQESDDPVPIARVRKLKRGPLQIAYSMSVGNVKLAETRAYLDANTTSHLIQVKPDTQLNGLKGQGATVTLEVRDATDVVWTDLPIGYAAPNNRQVLASSYTVRAERGLGIVGPTIQLANLVSDGAAARDPEATLVATLNTTGGSRAEVYGQADQNRLLNLSLKETVLPAGTYAGYSNLLKGTENVPMTMTVRHSAWWAALTLLAGLLTAALVAWVRNRLAPTLEWRAQIGRLLADAPQDCAAPVTHPLTNYSVLADYQQELQDLDRRIRREAWSLHAWTDPLGLAPNLTRLQQEVEVLTGTPKAWAAFRQSLNELARLARDLEAKLQASGDDTSNAMQVIKDIVLGRAIRPDEVADEHKKINEAALRVQTFEADPPQEYIKVLNNPPAGGYDPNAAKALKIAIAGLQNALKNPGNTNLAQMEESYARQVRAANNALIRLEPAAAPVANVLGLHASQLKATSSNLWALLTGGNPVSSSPPHLAAVSTGAGVLLRSRSLDASRMFVGLLLLLVTLAVTLIGGLETLYVPNATFGETAWDYVKAFVWGIGITAGVSAVLQGISGIRNTFALGGAR